MAVKGQAVSQYYILVIRKFIDFINVTFQCVVSLIFRCPRAVRRVQHAAVTLACVVQFQYQRTNAIREKSKEETRSLILKKQRFRI